MPLLGGLIGTRRSVSRSARSSAYSAKMPAAMPLPGAVNQSSMLEDIEEILISAEMLQERVRALADVISTNYARKDLLVVSVLKGAAMFTADLARNMSIPLELDFIAASSYGNDTESSGAVHILKDLEAPITGRHVLVVEDIIDSGLTLCNLLELLEKRGPASLRVCALLDKGKAQVPGRHVEATYLGFTIPDRFVVGYGLDYAQKYRNLPYIGILKPQVYQMAASV